MSHNRVCDRCCKVTNGDPLQAGWAAIKVDRWTDGAITKDLCDECYQKFAIFMDGKDKYGWGK